MMNFFSVLERCGAFIEIARSLQNNKTPVACFGLSHIHKAHYAAGLFHKLGCGGVILTPDESSARRFAEDLRAFLPDAAICAYPVKEILMLDALASSGEYEHLRIKALESLRQKNTVIGGRKKVYQPAANGKSAHAVNLIAACVAGIQ